MTSSYDIRQRLLGMEKPDVEQISEEEFESCLRVMRAMLGEDPEVSERARILQEMCAMTYRSARKSRHKERKRKRVAREAETLRQTGIRAGDEVARREAVRVEQQGVGELEQPRGCYVCKRPFVQVHHFYDRMCPECAPVHWLKRHQRADLSGRYVVLTGGRIKIGFELGLKMLRDGAELLVTTRFPRDAARRYGELEDFAQWQDRLHIYGVELRDVRSVERWCAEIANAVPWLDAVINNAAQTVRRPDAYYADVLEFERRGELSEHVERCVKRLDIVDVDGEVPLLDSLSTAMFPQRVERDGMTFPAGERDEDGLQLDLRTHNSWMMTLDEVEPMELLEVHLVNAVAPCLLNARLKALLQKSPHADRYIVNVAAKEGQFEVNFKSFRHPHTNMAKAGLNMLTRTSAADYERVGIHMTSVDTGWVTYEQPHEIKSEWFDEGKGPPLDVIDGAARIYDPIVRGVSGEERSSGVLYVNYEQASW